VLDVLGAETLSPFLCTLLEGLGMEMIKAVPVEKGLLQETILSN